MVQSRSLKRIILERSSYCPCSVWLPLADAPALVEALEHKHLAGAGLDVFDLEPPLPPNHPILNAPNTVLTPHIGYETAEAMSAKGNIALSHLENFLRS